MGDSYEVLQWVITVAVVPIVGGLAAWLKIQQDKLERAHQARIDDYKETIELTHSAIEALKEATRAFLDEDTKQDKSTRQMLATIERLVAVSEATMHKMEEVLSHVRSGRHRE